MTLADQIDIFYGRVTHHLAEVYVRVSSLVGGGEWSIAGQVRGPVAPGTRTLPTTVALRDLGAGPTLLGTCSIPDPTFWTTQLPGTYQVEVQLCREGQVVETVVRSLGIRFFGARGKDFLWEGKRWVLRGVASPVNAAEEIENFRDNAGVVVVNDPTESVLERASNSGVLLVVELTGGDLLPELRKLARWPAVALVIVPSGGGLAGELRAAAPNLLLAQRIDRDEIIELADWAHVAFCDASHVAALRNASQGSPLPIVAQRRLNGDFTLVAARRECDRLQRDLAPLGDLAGYVVRLEQVPLTK